MLNIQANLLHHLSDGTFHLSQAAGKSVVDVWPRNFPGQGVFLSKSTKKTKAPWMNELIFSQFAPFLKRPNSLPKSGNLVPVTIPTIQFSGVNLHVRFREGVSKNAQSSHWVDPRPFRWGNFPMDLAPKNLEGIEVVKFHGCCPFTCPRCSVGTGIFTYTFTMNWSQISRWIYHTWCIWVLVNEWNFTIKG